MAKTASVKELAKKYGVSTAEIIRELNSQGIDTDKGESSKIPEDMVELVEAYFDELYDPEMTSPADRSGKKGGKKTSGRREAERDNGRNRSGQRKESAGAGSVAPGSEIVLSSPIIIKNLAEAVGKKPNELITDLMKLGELAGINQAISENIARKLCESYHLKLVIESASGKNRPEAKKAEIVEDPGQLQERPPVVTLTPIT